jgi:sodium transport system permease protein
MNWHHVYVLLRKELIELLRDRRTLMSMIIAPAVIGPLVMFGINYFTTRSRDEARVERFKVAVGGNAMSGLTDALRAADLVVIPAADPRNAAFTKSADFGLRVTSDSTVPVVEIYSDQSDMKLQMGVRRITAALDSLRDRQVERALAARGLSANVLSPFTRRTINLAKPREMSGNLLGSLTAWMVLIFLFNIPRPEKRNGIRSRCSWFHRPAAVRSLPQRCCWPLFRRRSRPLSV